MSPFDGARRHHGSAPPALSTAGLRLVGGSLEGPSPGSAGARQLNEFLERFGGVRLEVLCTDRLLDLVEESFDLAIRAGPLLDSTLIARPLGVIEFILVASPRYLEKRGRPRSPEELPKHDCLIFGVGAQPGVLHLARGDEAHEVSVSRRR